MYDLQPETSFHYRPLWQPQYLNFTTRAARRWSCTDWYALKDPRQFYYGSYVNARARQRGNDGEEPGVRGQARPAGVAARHLREVLTLGVVPLRHVEWAANMNSAAITAYGFGSAITEAAMFHTMDRLGIAQYLTRIGLLTGNKEAVDAAKAQHGWRTWHGNRCAVRSKTCVVRDDWFELHVAQNLVMDGLLYPLIYQRLDARLSAESPAFSLVTDFMTAWYAETARWVDATVKTAAQESPANAGVISGFAFAWLDRFQHALAPLAHRLFAEEADVALAEAVAALSKRLGGLGLVREAGTTSALPAAVAAAA
ncbi:phenol hydroxylase [Cupriavidus basilensis]